MKVITGICDTDYLFSQDYIFRNLDCKKAAGYVNDYITDEMIEEWSENCEQPVFISAQTGSGKNYFVTHKLREYAKAKEQRILYVSNRVALDYQQKQELAKLTRTRIPTDTEFERWEHVEEFSNVTVTTYHKLSKYFSEKSEDWFQRFDYVVLDECHFFYSDAYFNAHTGYILENISQRFCEKVRIYMSATFEDIIDPICYYESGKTVQKHIKSNKRYYNCTPIYYCFARDFSNYSCYYFSKIEQIRDEIEKGQKNEKWIVFVTSKNEGDKLQKMLNESQRRDNLNSKLSSPIALYIDSASRTSEDLDSRRTWEKIKTNGKFDAQVLITTSVLDNGFSIKDSKIKNIVLCTSDKTEFIQELGRCRIDKDKKINVYIRKMSNKEQARRKRLHKDYSNLFLDFCGEIKKPGSGPSSKFAENGDPVQVIQRLWNTSEDFRRKLIYMVPTKERTLVPHINSMARWRTCQLGRQIKSYDVLFEKYNTMAEIIYKSLWLESDHASCSPNPQMLLEKDLDRRALDEARHALLEFLEEQAKKGEILHEEEKNFQEFAERFLLLYKEAFPGDPSVRRGQKRTWKHIAVQSHLEKASKQTDGRISFLLKEDSGFPKNGWCLYEI